MNKYLIRKEIASLIDSIKEHSEDIESKNQVPQLELEVILKKISKLYEKLIIYNYLNKIAVAEGNNNVPVLDPIDKLKKDSDFNDSILVKNSANKVIPEQQAVMELFASEMPPIPKPPKQKIIKNKAPLKPITDLKTAIGINEKFQFINELFDGNMQEYNIAIGQLDGMENFHEATIYLSNLKDVYKWKEETLVMANFLELIERRNLRNDK